MAHDREVAGIRCSEVLVVLSDYVDGDLAPDRRAQVDAHLLGCDWCERFGERFGHTVGDLRRLLGRGEAEPDRAERILRRVLGDAE